MQPQVINIKLAGVPSPPAETLQKSKGWVEFGPKHGFWSELLKIRRLSPTQRSVSKTKSDMIGGSGFSYDTTNKRLHEFLKEIKANKILKSIAKDIEFTGGFALQVVWDEAGESIAEVFHEPMRRVAFGLRDDEGEVTEFWLSKDWSKAGQAAYKPQMIKSFNPETAKDDKRQLYVGMTPSETNDYYAEPDCSGALHYLQLEADLAEFHLGNVQGNFSASNVMYIPEQPEPEEGQSQEAANDAYVSALEKKMTGPKGRRLVVIWGKNGDDGVASVQTLTPAQNAEIYSTYSALCVEKILAANRVTSPVIVGLPGGASLSGDASTIRAAFELFQSVVIRPAQVEIIEGFMEILGHVKGLDLKGTPDKPDLDIVTPLPVKMTFSEALMQDISEVDELRAMVDMPPLTDNQTGGDDDENGNEGNTPPAAAAQPVDANTAAQASLRGSVGGVTAILDVIERLGKQVIDRESALGILKNLFGFTKEQAEEILGTPKALPVGTEV